MVTNHFSITIQIKVYYDLIIFPVIFLKYTVCDWYFYFKPIICSSFRIKM